MTPPPRYTAHYHALTSRWDIYDRLLSRTIRAETSALLAADVVRAYEASWRTMCERWQWEEHRDSPPPSIF